MRHPTPGADYTQYVEARIVWLRRVAYLLTQDWQRADDLVQVTITRLFTRWPQAKNAANIDGYVRTILVRVFVAERRSSWFRRVVLPGSLPDHEIRVSDHDATLDVRDALRALPPRQRATLVLRYYCDLPVDETARVLGCTPGTVKSQTAKGLESLRRVLGPIPVREN
jgi:RNA polymerase sigma-70 factor (sigma-E family)